MNDDIVEILREAGYAEVILPEWPRRDAQARAINIGVGERVTPWFHPDDRARIVKEHGPAREGVVVGTDGPDCLLVLWDGDQQPTPKKRRLIERIAPDVRRAPTDDGGALVKIEPIDDEYVRAIYFDGACHSVCRRADVVCWPVASVAEFDAARADAIRRNQV